MTNGDKIRQMSNEELASYINGEINYTCNACIHKGIPVCNEKCKEGIKAYLDMEAEE